MKAYGAGLIVAAWLVSGCAGPPTPAPAGLAAAPGRSAAEGALGIAVEAVRWSADGFMLDFRYRVVDVEKARRVMDRSIKPYVIDEASGAKFVIPSSPKVGPMRQTTRQPEVGRMYWLLFANPGRHIKQGSRVTVVIGDAHLEHLVVE